MFKIVNIKFDTIKVKKRKREITMITIKYRKRKYTFQHQCEWCYTADNH